MIVHARMQTCTHVRAIYDPRSTRLLVTFAGDSGTLLLDEQGYHSDMGPGVGWNVENKAPVLGKPVAIMGGGGGGGHGGSGAFACIGFSDGGPQYGDQVAFEWGSGGGSGICTPLSIS